MALSEEQKQQRRYLQDLVEEKLQELHNIPRQTEEEMEKTASFSVLKLATKFNSPMVIDTLYKMVTGEWNIEEEGPRPILPPF